MADFPVYNEAAAERHWDELGPLCREAWIELLFSPFTPRHLAPTLKRWLSRASAVHGVTSSFSFFVACRIEVMRMRSAIYMPPTDGWRVITRSTTTVVGSGETSR